MSDCTIIKRFTASALGVLLARVIALLAVFGLNAILARRLSPGDFGSFVLFFSLTGLFSLIACLGLNRAIVKRLAEADELSPESVRSLLRFGLLIAIGGGCLVAPAVSVGGYFLLSDVPSRLTLAVLFGAIVLIRTIHLYLSEAARGFHERLWSNLFGGPAGGPLPHLLFVGMLLAAGNHIQDSLVVAIGLYLLAFAVTLPMIAWRVYALTGETSLPSIEDATGATELNFASAEISDGLLALGIPLMLTQTCGLAISQADIWIAGAMAAPSAIATYAAAQRLLALLTISLQIAGMAIVNFVPELAAKSKTQLQQMVGIAATGGGLPGIALSIVFLIYAKQILVMVFGPHYESGALILRILTAGQIVCLLTGPCEIVLMMAGHQRSTLRVNICAAVALVMLGPLGILGFGMTGLATAIAVVTATQNLVNCYLAHRLLGIAAYVGAMPGQLANLHRTSFHTKPRTVTK